VIHLFRKNSASRQLPLSSQVVESLPIESQETRLLPLLLAIFDRLEGREGINPVQNTELAFRNVVQSLREQRLADREAPGLGEAGGALRAPGTSLKIAERVLLNPQTAPLPVSSPSVRRSPWHWLFGRREARH
jgi:hypothetical protein